MSEHTKKLHISAQAHGGTLHITVRNRTFAIPKKVIEKYEIENKTVKTKKKNSVSLQQLLDKLDTKFTKAGSLLKGLRLRERLSQIEFAKKINVTQANLSNMENGKRPVGKIVAKRIEKAFGACYRYFLE